MLHAIPMGQTIINIHEYKRQHTISTHVPPTGIKRPSATCCFICWYSVGYISFIHSNCWACNDMRLINPTINKHVGPPCCPIEMHAGHVTCCPLVSHVEHAPHALLKLVIKMDWQMDRRTDRRGTVTLCLTLDEARVITALLQTNFAILIMK